MNSSEEQLKFAEAYVDYLIKKGKSENERSEPLPKHYGVDEDTAEMLMRRIHMARDNEIRNKIKK